MPARNKFLQLCERGFTCGLIIGRHRRVPPFGKVRQLNPPSVAKRFFAEERLIVLARFGKATKSALLPHLGQKANAELGLARLFEGVSFNVEHSAVIAAADAALVHLAVVDLCSLMRAARGRDQDIPPVAKQNKVFAGSAILRGIPVASRDQAPTCQYRRMSSPMGVPRPTSVNSLR